MKGLISILVLISLTISSFAQSVTPRFGTTSSDDNTGRILTYKYAALTDAAGADSAILRPDNWNNIYKITLTDSFTLKQPVVTASYFGDEIIIICSAASGTPKLKFSGSNWVTAGTATLSTGLRAIISLRFDGAKYVEQSRVVQ
jgi:hypothetical protein